MTFKKENENQKGGLWAETKETLRMLYWDKSHFRTSLALTLMNPAVSVIYFLGIYNSIELKGNIFTIEIIFGSALLSGVAFSEYVLHYVNATTCMIVANLFIMAIALIIKTGLNYHLFYFLFIIQSVFIGSIVNFIMVIGCTRIDPRYLSMSCELGLSIGQLISSICPIFAVQKEPIPTLVFLFSGALLFISLLIMGQQNGDQKKLAQVNLKQSVKKIAEAENKGTSKPQFGLKNSTRFGRRHHSDGAGLLLRRSNQEGNAEERDESS